MDEPYNELSLMFADGRQVPPARFRTVQEAMTAAEDYRGAFGSILYYPAAGLPALVVVQFNADGTVDVGDDVDDDDDEDGWTEEELAANFAAGREPTAAERAQFGIAQ
jgi:hypothetical protein